MTPKTTFSRERVSGEFLCIRLTLERSYSSRECFVAVFVQLKSPVAGPTIVALGLYVRWRIIVSDYCIISNTFCFSFSFIPCLVYAFMYLPYGLLVFGFSLYVYVTMDILVFIVFHFMDSTVWFIVINCAIWSTDHNVVINLSWTNMIVIIITKLYSCHVSSLYVWIDTRSWIHCCRDNFQN